MKRGTWNRIGWNIQHWSLSTFEWIVSRGIEIKNKGINVSKSLFRRFSKKKTNHVRNQLNLSVLKRPVTCDAIQKFCMFSNKKVLASVRYNTIKANHLRSLYFNRVVGIMLKSIASNGNMKLVWIGFDHWLWKLVLCLFIFCLSNTYPNTNSFYAKHEKFVW